MSIKKILLMLCLTFGLSQISNAQLQFGVKGGINYNNNGDLTLSGVVNNAVAGADAKSGFHVGMWFRGKLPIVGIYIRPEIVFTQVKSEYLYKGNNTSYDFKKIDVPVLFGKKIFGFANVFIDASKAIILFSTDNEAV